MHGPAAQYSPDDGDKDEDEDEDMDTSSDKRLEKPNPL